MLGPALSEWLFLPPLPTRNLYLFVKVDVLFEKKRVKSRIWLQIFAVWPPLAFSRHVSRRQTLALRAVGCLGPVTDLPRGFPKARVQQKPGGDHLACQGN
jgi:hypothetical protein